MGPWKIKQYNVHIWGPLQGAIQLNLTSFQMFNPKNEVGRTKLRSGGRQTLD